MIYPYLVGALNSGETGSPGRESSAPNPPVPPAFSTQPTLAPDPVSIGNTLTLTEGIAGPDATLTIESFTLDGVDKTGELSGLTWDTTGEAAGAISYQVRAINSGGFVLSDVITGTLNADVSAPDDFVAGEYSIGGQNGTLIYATISTAPADNGTAITKFQYRVNEGAVRDFPAGTTAGTYELNLSDNGDADEGDLVRLQIRAFNGSGNAWTDAEGFCLWPADPRAFRGRNPDQDYGTTGLDAVVSPEGNDGTADGTASLPYLTLAAAITDNPTAPTIALRGGVHRWNHETLPANTTLRPYGREHPKVTNQIKVTGFTQCDATDTILGAQAIASSPVYKATITGADVSGITDIININPTEAGRQLIPSNIKPSNRTVRRALQDHLSGYTADTFVLDGLGNIEHIDDADVIGTRTDADFDNAYVGYYHAPNINTITPMLSSDVASDRLTISPASAPQDTSYLYSVINMPGEMDQDGFWSIVPDGSDWTIYVRPYDAANIGLIEVSTTNTILKSTASGIDVQGLELTGGVAENGAGTDGCALLVHSTSGKATGTVFKHNRVTNFEGITQANRVVQFYNCDDVESDYNDVFGGIGRGMWSRSSGGASSSDNRFYRNHFREISGPAFYTYDQFYHVAVQNYAVDTSLETHTSRDNNYSVTDISHDILSWGNEYANGRGPISIQGHGGAASYNLVAAYNWLPIDNSGAPYNVTIQHYAGTVPGGAKSYILNNTITPHVSNPEGGTSIFFSAATETDFEVANNIAHGIDHEGNFSGIDATVDRNVITYLDSGQTEGVFNLSNAVEETLSLVYTDAANSDYSPASGGPILTTLGKDYSPLVTTLETDYAKVTSGMLDEDYAGNIIDWDDRPIGADASLTWLRGTRVFNVEGISDGSTGGTAFWEVGDSTDTVYVGAWPVATTPTDAEVTAGTGATWTTSASAALGLMSATMSGLTDGSEYRIWVRKGSGTAVSSAVFEAGIGPADNVLPYDTFVSTDFGSETGFTFSGGVLTIDGATSFDQIDTVSGSRADVLSSAPYNISVDVTRAVDDGFRIYVVEYNSGGTEIAAQEMFNDNPASVQTYSSFFETSATTATIGLRIQAIGADNDLDLESPLVTISTFNEVAAPAATNQLDNDPPVVWTVDTGVTLAGGVATFPSGLANFSGIANPSTDGVVVIGSTTYTITLDCTTYTSGRFRFGVTERTAAGTEVVALSFLHDTNTDGAFTVGENTYSLTTAATTEILDFELESISGGEGGFDSLTVEEA